MTSPASPRVKRPPPRLWLLTAALVAAVTAFSYLQLPDEAEFSAAFFHRWMPVGLFLASLIMALLDPDRWRYWGVAVGLFPVTAVAIFMMIRGPGNIWPIALALALAFGLVPAFAGVVLGRTLRRIT